MPVTRDSKGNVTIDGSVVNNIYNSSKNDITAFDGYYLYKPVRTLRQFVDTEYGTGISDDDIAIATSWLNTQMPGGVVWQEYGGTFYIPQVPIKYYALTTNGYLYGYTEKLGQVTFDKARISVKNVNRVERQYSGGVSSYPSQSAFSRLIGSVPVKLFYSVQALKDYLGGNNKVLLTQNYYNYDPLTNNSLMFNADKVLSQNWDDISSKIVNSYNREIQGKDYTDSEKQMIADEMYQNILQGLGDIGGNVSNVNATLSMWLSRIYKKIETLASDLKLQTGLIIDGIKDIPKGFKTYFDDLIKAIKEIDVGSGGGGLASGAGSLVGSALGGLLGGAIQKFIDGLIPEEALGDAVSSALGSLSTKFQPVAIASKKKFPISLPWDFISVVMLFNAKPEVPRFELPLKLEHYGIDEKVVLDMSEFERLSKASRAILSATFLLMLILITAKFLRVVNDT